MNSTVCLIPEMYLFFLVGFNILVLAAWAVGRALCSVIINRSSHAGSTGLSWICSPKPLINHSRLPVIFLYPFIYFAKHCQYLFVIYFYCLWVCYLNVQVSDKYMPALLCSRFITTCHMQSDVIFYTGYTMSLNKGTKSAFICLGMPRWWHYKASDNFSVISQSLTGMLRNNGIPCMGKDYLRRANMPWHNLFWTLY